MNQTLFVASGQAVTSAGPAYRSTKRYGHDQGLSCAFRQWRASSHCRVLHGYALAFTLVFEAHELDRNGWVLDFGALKPVKAMLADTFDHRTILAQDDPDLDRFKEMACAGALDLLVLPRVGCEAFAGWVYREVATWLVTEGHAPRVRLVSVEVAEHGANSATCQGAGLS